MVVETTAGDQLVVASCFHEAALLEDADEVGGADGGETVGDHERCASVQQPFDVLGDCAFGFSVQTRSTWSSRCFSVPGIAALTSWWLVLHKSGTLAPLVDASVAAPQCPVVQHRTQGWQLQLGACRRD